MNLPADPKEAVLFLWQELEILQDKVLELERQNQVTSVAPSKPRQGMLRFADGIGWNPGAGAGYYQYKGGAWIAL